MRVARCAITLALLTALLPRPVLAEWDPARIASTKEAAEQAYSANDFPKAALHYIELRKLLKDAIAEGSVPPEYLEGVRLALTVSTYQLGRANQQSGNCSGAALVYQELLGEMEADPSMQSRTLHRLAESQLCQHEAVQGAFDVTHVLETQRTLETLRPLLPQLDDTTELQAEVETLEETLLEEQGRLANALFAEVGREALDSTRCAQLEPLLEPPHAWAAGLEVTPAQWKRARADHTRACTVRADVPLEPVDEGLPSEPGWVLLGVGVATLVGAVIADALVLQEIEEYRELNEDCATVAFSSCNNARNAYQELEGKPELVLGLYIGGGILTAAGLTWILLTMDSDPPEGVSWSVSPALEGGFTARLRWVY